MLSKKCLLVFVFISSLYNINAQNCNINIKGKLVDELTQKALSYANIYIQETFEGTVSDEQGNFSFKNICAGEYHLVFSHIGCEITKVHLNLYSDTILNIALQHHETALNTVVVNGTKDGLENQTKVFVSRKEIEDNTNENLANIIENESGVSLIKNGSGIAKPVVHGLYGNRLTILNNGIIQSGQQWGNDHSPEIDPFSADKITILKGASAIEYGGGNLGSVVLIEPKHISKEPHLHGQVNYAFESNGNGNNLNARLEQYTPALAWRINGTLKKYGDRRSSRYFLNNTGSEEANISIQLEKSWNNKFFLDFYASTFNTKIGVLKGLHIGNLTDLEEAFLRDEPFFTEEKFSYKIDAPKQHVSHHFTKLKARYYFKEKQNIEFVVAGQLNDRKEFDVRRGGRSEIPALSLLQFTLNTDLKYTKEFEKNWLLKVGNQNIVTDNTNNPETGVLPLIPDYFSWETGIFSSISKKTARANLNFGLRYDFELQNVATISNTKPRKIVRYKNHFHNAAALFAVKVKLTTTQSLIFNTGFAMRNPAINELYSGGLHQGVGGIEEGDINLRTENALKNTLEYLWQPSSKFSLNALVYHQYFKDYIFLKPQEEIRLTIRGAFPVFKYEQTNAQIYGLDLSSRFMFWNSVFGQLKYSYLRGTDLKNKEPLVFMPANSLYGSLAYRVLKPIKISKKVKLDALEFEVNNRFVFKQTNLIAEQDFVAAPAAYNLLGLKVSTNIIFKKYKVRFIAKAENVLNTRYRDYLNRQRYFADDTGISLTLGINFKF